MRRYVAVVVAFAVLAASDGAGDPAGDADGDSIGDVEVETSRAADTATQTVGKEPQTVDPATDSDAPVDALSARARYNAGLDNLEGGDFAAAAGAFLAARDDARGDPILRYRSAFNLGLALAGRADAEAEASPQETIETLRSSAAWFSDAARLAAEGDDDARVNLEIVLRRIQQLADQINSDGHLEARLDRIIDDQRGLRDQLRQLLTEIESETGTDFRHRFESLAASERALLAETADVADLAAEERAHLEGRDEEALAADQRARAYQLASMDHYLQRARQSLGDTRRRLRRLEGERAHRRADTALAELKRAREQLLHPVAVLKAVARDESALVAHADALAGVSSEAGPPPWLTVSHLTNRQEDAAARTGEMLRRLEAALAAKPTSEPAGNQEDAPVGDSSPYRSGNPEAERVRQAIGEAVPHVREALDAMRSALSSYAAAAVSDAAREGARAITALSRAIERFAGLRELIEIAYADQTRAVALLEADDEEVPADLRTRLARAAVDENRERLRRMRDMLVETLASAEADDAASDERYQRAETLRGDALEALDAASKALAAGSGANPPAGLALERLEALRRLFFSIVEHLQELLAEQTDTHDQTATAQVEPEAGPPLGFVAERQTSHAEIGQALGEALAAQTDAARADDNAESAQSIAEATGEVRAAATRMRGAAATVSAAAKNAQSMSPHLEPALDDQLAAMGHIEHAIRLLRPPSEQAGDSGGERQQQAQAVPQPEAAEQMSRRQALQRLQAVRDREAERQRRRQRDPAPPAPVEKDW